MDLFKRIRVQVSPEPENKTEVTNILTVGEIEKIFDKQAFLKNIDEIYSRFGI